jgi:hypothetical protein
VWQASQFTLDPSQASSLDNQQISPAISAAFQQHGCTLGYGATVDVINVGRAWTITAGTVVSASSRSSRPAVTRRTPS